MQTCSVRTHEFDLDISRYITRHMEKADGEYSIIDCGESYLCADTATDERYKNFCSSICEFIVQDLAKFTLADMIRNIPLPVSDRKEILKGAIQYAQKSVLRSKVRRDISQYFIEHRCMTLEGYINFRMHDTRIIWERCVECATENLLLQKEQAELAHMLASYAAVEIRNDIEVSLIINADGTCSVVDNSEMRIDYPKDSESGVVNLLIAVCPAQITVYDLSGGEFDDFLIVLCNIFEGRVSVYRTVNE